ncbi:MULTISPECIES: tetratricopeptide repeat protein [unclassified Carboxylicivirga]|uniref:tetratricopeptide repeat protein n=1 Tax=Carboxylicivirga TaxID=1628153 RepID=UPI003D338B19
MKKTDFFDLVAQPALLDESSLPALHEIVDEFPWFQSARMLLIKNLHTLEHVRFNGTLKQSAAYIADRKRLYELIHTTAVQKVPQSEIIKPAEPAKKTQLAAAPVKTDKPRAGMTAKVSSVSEYFQTDDTFETENGSTIDFSVLPKKKPLEEKPAMVMPSADFLGYESSDFVGYELKESINPEEKEDESHSFSGWLTMLRHAPAETESKPVMKKSQQIIDNFLQIESPRIVPTPKAHSDVENTLSADNEPESNSGDDLMSETLADIYIKQKHYDKAITIYEKLRLKYPEKNVYFARRISDLEKLTN